MMSGKQKRALGVFLTAVLFFLTALPAFAAYKAHNNDSDTNCFLTVYPEAKGTKLDNCYLCHTGGTVGKKYLDSCDYCHSVYGFRPPHGDAAKTMNSFGLAYRQAGRNLEAVKAIAALDSDGDGFTNEQEIAAVRLPGDKNDNPSLLEAPAKIYTRAEIRKLPKVKEFVTVDTAKAGDFYGDYGGVTIWELLQDAGVSEEAVDITVFAADGYSRNFPISDLKKDYEQGKFFTCYPWLSYPLGRGLQNGEQLPGRLHYLLAYEREGFPLEESKIMVGADGRSSLKGEGPYRFVAPLTEPVVPDRSQWAIDRDDPPYPYNPNRPITRNADYCIKAIVAIRVNTADNKSAQFDWNGRAWEMIQNGELAVYGAINTAK